MSRSIVAVFNVRLPVNVTAAWICVVPLPADWIRLLAANVSDVASPIVTAVALAIVTAPSAAVEPTEPST